jgi:branched-chain amino acid transport system ATP-binding protein
LAIIGPNGAGKSTLFNLISGLSSPSEGEVLLQGQSLKGKTAFEINRLGLDRSFQISNLFPRLSVFDNLRCALLWSLGYRYTLFRFLANLTDANERTQMLLERLGLEKKQHQLAASLSYAEQRALEIGVTLAGGASVILLDEPSAGMNPSETRHFVRLIRDLTQGKTLLMVEHDMGVVFDLADRIAVLVNGELLALDSPAAVRANERVQQAYLGMPPASQPMQESH